MLPAITFLHRNGGISQCRDKKHAGFKKLWESTSKGCRKSRRPPNSEIWSLFPVTYRTAQTHSTFQTITHCDNPESPRCLIKTCGPSSNLTGIYSAPWFSHCSLACSPDPYFRHLKFDKCGVNWPRSGKALPLGLKESWNFRDPRQSKVPSHQQGDWGTLANCSLNGSWKPFSKHMPY